MTTTRKIISTNAAARPSAVVGDPAAAKAALLRKGITLKEFAKKNGFSYRTVSEVVRGVNKGLYGQGHQVAVALGLKGGA